MHNRILGRSLLFFLLTTFVAIAIQIQSTELKSTHTKEVKLTQSALEHQRLKRGTVRKPGFFRTLFSVIYEQWNDTRNTVGTINNLVNDNFLPDNAPKIETTTSSDPNISTTTPAYKITRTEFNKIIRRNLKGLVRLYNIELQDALKQSDKNYAEFQKNASREISKFL